MIIILAANDADASSRKKGSWTVTNLIDLIIWKIRRQSLFRLLTKINILAYTESTKCEFVNTKILIIEKLKKSVFGIKISDFVEALSTT